MYRVIFCPSEIFLEEANALANKMQLPILVGHNEDTKNIIFNDKVVSIIKVPQIRSLDILNESIEVGFHQVIKYVNEFVDLKNNTRLYVNNNLVKPVFEEKHKCNYSYYCDTIGSYSCDIFVREDKLESFSFAVC
jgi:hypothetical protein